MLIRRRNLPVFGLLVLTIAANAFFVVFAAGDFFPLYRFLQPTFAIAYVVGTVPIVVLLRLIANPRQRVLAQLAIVLLALGLQPAPYKVRGQAALRSSYTWNHLLKEGVSSKLTTPKSSVGKWLMDSLPADAVIATGQCGEIPYYSELETVDLRGLNDRYLARNPLSYDYLERRGVSTVILQVVSSPDGPSTLYTGLVGDVEFQADFTLTHRLAGQNQHGNTLSFAVFMRRDVDAPQVETDRPKGAPPLHELLADPSVTEVAL